MYLLWSVVILVMGACSSGERVGDVRHAEERPFVAHYRIETANQAIILPLRIGFDYNFTVDWGDGSQPALVTAHDDTDARHVYKTAGDYHVRIRGLMEAWGRFMVVDRWGTFKNASRNALVSVPSLGDVGLKNLEGAFYGYENLRYVGGGDTSAVTTMRSMFQGASAVVPDVSGWDTGNVNNMWAMFAQTQAAEPDMSSWNFTNVECYGYMFSGSTLSPSLYSSMLQRIVATSNKRGHELCLLVYRAGPFPPVPLKAGAAKLAPSDSDGQAARHELINREWLILDGEGLHGLPRVLDRLTPFDRL